MLKTIRHRGLKRLYEHDDPSKVRADQVKRISDVLAHLDRALKPSDVDLPDYRLHPLKGDLGDVERNDIRKLADHFPHCRW